MHPNFSYHTYVILSSGLFNNPTTYIPLITIRRLRNNGNKLFNKATQLFNDIANLQPISGPIGSVHRYVDTETIEVQRFDESTGQTQTMSLCKGALGFGYVGLDPEEFPFLETIRDLIKAPSEEMVQCQRLVRERALIGPFGHVGF